MRPQSNWQFLLLSQIHRGAYFMDPRMVMGLRPTIEKILMDTDPDTISERDEYPIQVYGIDQVSGFQLLQSPDTTPSADSNRPQDSIYDEVPEGSTAVFRIAGALLKYGSWCDYGTEEIAGFIRQAANHPHIGSIVLDIDSGGGSVSAIAPMLQVIRESKAAGKPVIASVDMCCSAALYIASECNQVLANNNISSEIGSIGVMVSFWDVAPYYKKEGFAQHTIYATQSTHKNQPFELALEGKYELIKSEMLDPLAIQFQEHIRTTRKGKLDESVPGILAGRTFFADAAQANGLIDGIGNISLAIERAQQLATLNKFFKT